MESSSSIKLKSINDHRWFANKFAEVELLPWLKPICIPLPEKIMHMCFTRPGIFYKNTHYLFSGTKSELQVAFTKLQTDIEEEKKEPYFGRGDHDDLLDMPLDTFCNNLCHCHNDIDKTSNYKCSQWELMNFHNQEELDNHIKAIATKKIYYNSFPTEIICI